MIVDKVYTVSKYKSFIQHISRLSRPCPLILRYTLQSQIESINNISDFTSIRLKSHLNRTSLITSLTRTSEHLVYLFRTRPFYSSRPKSDVKATEVSLRRSSKEICRSISSLISSTIFDDIYRRDKQRRSLRIRGVRSTLATLFATTPHCHRASRRRVRHSLLHSTRSICLADEQNRKEVFEA